MSFKTKMKEIYCFQKLNIIKNQNDWFPKKKKIRYKDLDYDIHVYDTATLNLLIQNEIVLIKCLNFVSKVQSKIINQ